MTPHKKTGSQARMLSGIFKKLRVDINCFKNIQDQLKDNAIKDVLAQILELEEGGPITITNIDQIHKNVDYI